MKMIKMADDVVIFLPELDNAVNDEPIVRVSFRDIGEGICGDYDPKNPEDKKLLRMDVDLAFPGEDDFSEIPGASACTQLPVGTDPKLLEQTAAAAAELTKGLVNEAKDRDFQSSFSSIVHLVEYLSWSDPKRPAFIPNYNKNDVDRAMRRAHLTGPSGRLEAYRILTEYGFPVTGMDVDDVMDRWEDDKG